MLDANQKYPVEDELEPVEQSKSLIELQQDGWIIDEGNVILNPGYKGEVADSEVVRFFYRGKWTTVRLD